jgi:hypothetical protein
VIAEAARFGDEEQQAFVARTWIFKRGPVRAAREILAAAEDMSALQRCVAVELVDRLLGDDALPAWREMASARCVGPFARAVLAAWDRGPEPDDADGDWLAVEGAAEETGDEDAVRIRDAMVPGGSIAYTYDFGACWEHEITLEKTLRRDHSQDYPVCVAFRGDSPVEYWSEEEPEEPSPFGLNEVNRRLAALGREPA